MVTGGKNRSTRDLLGQGLLELGRKTLTGGSRMLRLGDRQYELVKSGRHQSVSSFFRWYLGYSEIT